MIKWFMYPSLFVMNGEVFNFFLLESKYCLSLQADYGAMGSGTFAPRFKQSVTVVTIKYKTPCFFSTFFLVVCRKFCNFAGR